MISPTHRHLPDTTRHSQQTDIHDHAGFEPTISASERLQIHASRRRPAPLPKRRKQSVTPTSVRLYVTSFSTAILKFLASLSCNLVQSMIFCLGFDCPQLLRQQLQWQMTLDTPRRLHHLHFLDSVSNIRFLSGCFTHQTTEPEQITEI